MEKTETINSFHVRMPKDLKERLAEQAEKEKRSLNNQIVHVLELYSQTTVFNSTANTETALAK